MKEERRIDGREERGKIKNKKQEKRKDIEKRERKVRKKKISLKE